MKQTTRKLFQSLTVLILSLVVDDVSAQTRHLRVIALADDMAPGCSQTETFSSFYTASINNSGEVAFVGTSTGGRGIWKGSEGALQSIKLEGEIAAGTSGDVRYDSFEYPHINNGGDVTFSSYLAGDHVNGLSQVGIWSSAGGPVRKVVRQGDPLPSSMGDSPCFSCSNPFPSLANGELFCSVNPIGIPLFNDAGDVVFKSQVSSVTPDMAGNPISTPEEYHEGIWMNRGGIIKKIVELGDTMPDGAGVITGFHDLIHFAKLNDNGDIAFWAFTENGAGSWILRHDAASGAFETLVAPNTPVDHIGPGLTIAGASLQGFNNNQQALFSTAINGPGVTNLTNASLWIKDQDGLHLVAREGDSVPDSSLHLGRTGSPNFTFISAAFSGNGTAAFAGQTDSGNGLFTASKDGELKLHAYGGMQAPGLPAGVTFNNSLGNGGNIAVNHFGQIAFYANVSGPGIDGSGRSVWVTDRVGGLHLVFLDGQILEYRPGEFRNVGVGIAEGVRSGNQEGDVIALNDRGEVVFTTEWGVFVSAVGTIPEPGSELLLAVGSLLASWRRR